MENYLILQSQKNLILQAIVDIGLSASEFEWLVKDSQHIKSKISSLRHGTTEFFFDFEIYRGDHYSIRSPGKTMIVEASYSGSWEEQWAYVKFWLEYLKREIESPDLWGAIAQESELINAANSENDNTPFNEGEKKNIVSGINEIRQYLIEVHKISAELIEPRLKYLEESSGRLGRKDWINVLFSVIIGIILNATVTPESSREILRFVGTVLHQILQHLPLLN